MSDEAVAAVEAEPETTQTEAAPAEATPEPTGEPTPGDVPVEGIGGSVAPVEEEAVPTEEKEAEAEAVKAAPALPPALVARAVRAGLEDDEILGHDTPEALERACALLERRASKGAPAAQQQEAPVPLEFKIDLKDPATGQDIGEEQLDPVMMKNLKGMAQFVNSLAKAAHASAAEQQSAIRAIQTQAHVDWLDGAVAGLGEQYTDTFGKGTIHDLDPNGAQMKNRVKLDNAMATIANGCVARGQAVPNKKALLQQALGMAFGQDAKTQARKEVAAKLDQRASQMTMRPSQRTATPPAPLTPEEEARAAARAVMSKKGLLLPEAPIKEKRRK